MPYSPFPAPKHAPFRGESSDHFDKSIAQDRLSADRDGEADYLDQGDAYDGTERNLADRRHSDKGRTNLQDGGGDLGSLLGSSGFLNARHIAAEETPAIANEITNILEQHQGCLTAAKLGSKIARRDAGVLFRAEGIVRRPPPLLEMFPDQFHIEVRHPNIFVRIPSTASSSARSELSRKKAARIAAAKKRHSTTCHVSKNVKDSGKITKNLKLRIRKLDSLRMMTSLSCVLVMLTLRRKC